MNNVESMKQKGTGKPKSKVMMIRNRAIVTAISSPPKTSAAA
jgi:hypothetical protein